MPKTPSIKLFTLIHSLSGSEKRYFKVFAKKTANEASNKYLKLFEAILKQDNYEEESLKKLIYGQGIIKSRKFSELKNYLYELILKSLQSFDEKTSIDFTLKSKLNNVRVLAKRSLYADCKEILQKAKKIAYQYEKFLAILEILDWEKRIAYAESNIRFLDEELETIFKEEKQLISFISDEMSYYHIFFQMLISLKKDTIARTEDRVNELKAIINHHLLDKNFEGRTHKSRILYDRIHGFFQHTTRSYTDYYHTNERLLTVMESDQGLLSEDPSEYISVINNQIYCCGMLRKYDEMHSLLDKMKIVKPVSFDDKYKIFTLYYLNKMVLYTESGSFKEGVALIAERDSQLDQFKGKQLFNVNYYFIYSNMYFGVADYDTSLIWLNKLLDTPKQLVRQDLQSVARIMLLIIHYEMGNGFLLEYLLRSTYRYLRSRNRLYQFELRIIKFIRKSGRIITKQELREEFKTLKADFETMAKNPSESSMLRYFDFISWLESKIVERSFAELIQDKYQDQISKNH